MMIDDKCPKNLTSIKCKLTGMTERHCTLDFRGSRSSGEEMFASNTKCEKLTKKIGEKEQIYKVKI